MKTLVCAFGEWGCAGLDALEKAGFGGFVVHTHEGAGEFGRSVAQWCEVRGVSYAYDMPRPQAADFIFSFHYRQLLPQAVLDGARGGAFNLHPSLLPMYRGRAPVNWVLVRGEKETGVTLHHMSARADAGDIVAQVAVGIDEADNALALNLKLLAAAQPMLEEYLPLILAGRAPRRAQDVAAGCYVGRRTPEDGRINWHNSAQQVHDLIRAVAPPYPGAFSFCGGKKLMLLEARVSEGSGAPGQVLGVSPLVVACGQGAVEIMRHEGALPEPGHILGA